MQRPRQGTLIAHSEEDPSVAARTARHLVLSQHRRWPLGGCATDSHSGNDRGHRLRTYHRRYAFALSSGVRGAASSLPACIAAPEQRVIVRQGRLAPPDPESSRSVAGRKINPGGRICPIQSSTKTSMLDPMKSHSLICAIPVLGRVNAGKEGLEGPTSSRFVSTDPPLNAHLNWPYLRELRDRCPGSKFPRPPATSDTRSAPSLQCESRLAGSDDARLFPLPAGNARPLESLPRPAAPQ